MIAPIIRPHLQAHRLAPALAMVGATGDLARGAAAGEDRDRPRHPRRHIHVVDVVALVYLVLVRRPPRRSSASIVLCSARAGERFLGDLRIAAYDKLQELSLPFFEETRAGVLVSRLTADVQTLTTFTRQVLVEVVGSVLLFVVTLVILVVALAAALARDARLGAAARRGRRCATASARGPRSSRSATASPTR